MPLLLSVILAFGKQEDQEVDTHLVYVASLAPSEVLLSHRRKMGNLVTASVSKPASPLYKASLSLGK